MYKTCQNLVENLLLFLLLMDVKKKSWIDFLSQLPSPEQNTPRSSSFWYRWNASLLHWYIATYLLGLRDRFRWRNPFKRTRKLLERKWNRTPNIHATISTTKWTESFQQTIINGAETMQHHTGLSNGFCIYAVKAKIHMYSVTPIKKQTINTKRTMGLENTRYLTPKSFKVSSPCTHPEREKTQTWAKEPKDDLLLVMNWDPRTEKQKAGKAKTAQFLKNQTMNLIHWH